MKKILKTMFALLAIVAAAAFLCPTETRAASSQKCYTISTGNTRVYKDKSLTKSYGTIYDSDEITVITVTDKYSKVSYPISGGKKKTGYIKTSAILLKTTGKSYKSKAKITTYKRIGGSTYGYISAGDKVLVIGTKGSYTQIKYPVSGGYKYAFISTKNANKYIIGNSPEDNSSSGESTKLSYGLYKNSSAYISCKFDGYKTVSGRHEGIDIKCKKGASVYSLVSGTVLRVANGKNGSKGLSTIAIYDKSADKTVIYLHTNPVSLHKGQSISKGQKIATEGWRGISSASASHTHVEVRNKKQTHAAVSVGDSKLDNPNPTSYWESKGYKIQ